MSLCFYLLIPIKSEKIIFIPKGSTKNIITHLKDKGYRLSFLDVYFLKLIGKPQSGWIELPKETLSRAEFLYALTISKSATTSVTLIPGETNYFFLRTIAKKFNFDNVEKLKFYYDQYSPYADGVILADTYNLPYHADEEFIIQYLVNISLKQHEKIAKELLGYYDLESWFKIVSKASIIQKEAANVSEMPIISSVIDNRIKMNMPLQMDGSLNYGKYSHIKITPDRIRNDTTEFNTYKYVGIPKTPCGSVSIDAIKAAIHPEITNFLYFMRNKNGTHDFTHSYKRHLKNINNVKN